MAEIKESKELSRGEATAIETLRVALQYGGSDKETLEAALNPEISQKSLIAIIQENLASNLSLKDKAEEKEYIAKWQEIQGQQKKMALMMRALLIKKAEANGISKAENIPTPERIAELKKTPNTYLEFTELVEIAESLGIPTSSTMLSLDYKQNGSPSFPESALKPERSYDKDNILVFSPNGAHSARGHWQAGVYPHICDVTGDGDCGCYVLMFFAQMEMLKKNKSMPAETAFNYLVPRTPSSGRNAEIARIDNERDRVRLVEGIKGESQSLLTTMQTSDNWRNIQAAQQKIQSLMWKLLALEMRLNPQHFQNNRDAKMSTDDAEGISIKAALLNESDAQLDGNQLRELAILLGLDLGESVMLVGDQINVENLPPEIKSQEKLRLVQCTDQRRNVRWKIADPTGQIFDPVGYKSKDTGLNAILFALQLKHLQENQPLREKIRVDEHNTFSWLASHSPRGGNKHLQKPAEQKALLPQAAIQLEDVRYMFLEPQLKEFLKLYVASDDAFQVCDDSEKELEAYWDAEEEKGVLKKSDLVKNYETVQLAFAELPPKLQLYLVALATGDKVRAASNWNGVPIPMALRIRLVKNFYLANVKYTELPEAMQAFLMSLKPTDAEEHWNKASLEERRALILQLRTASAEASAPEQKKKETEEKVPASESIQPTATAAASSLTPPTLPAPPTTPATPTAITSVPLPVHSSVHVPLMPPSVPAPAPVLPAPAPAPAPDVDPDPMSVTTPIPAHIPMPAPAPAPAPAPVPTTVVTTPSVTPQTSIPTPAAVSPSQSQPEKVSVKNQSFDQLKQNFKSAVNAWITYDLGEGLQEGTAEIVWNSMDPSARNALAGNIKLAITKFDQLPKPFCDFLAEQGIGRASWEAGKLQFKHGFIKAYKENRVKAEAKAPARPLQAAAAEAGAGVAAAAAPAPDDAKHPSWTKPFDQLGSSEQDFMCEVIMPKKAQDKSRVKSLWDAATPQQKEMWGGIYSIVKESSYAQLPTPLKSYLVGKKSWDACSESEKIDVVMLFMANEQIKQMERRLQSPSNVAPSMAIFGGGAVASSSSQRQASSSQGASKK